MSAVEATLGEIGGTVIGPKCDDKLAPGHWRCVTHAEDFPHNWAMQSHSEDGQHVIAWVCHVHGPEVP